MHCQHMQAALCKVGGAGVQGCLRSISCRPCECGRTLHLAERRLLPANPFHSGPFLQAGVLLVRAVPAPHAAAQRGGRRRAAPRPLLCATLAGQPDLQQGRPQVAVVVAVPAVAVGGRYCRLCCALLGSQIFSKVSRKLLWLCIADQHCKLACACCCLAGQQCKPCLQ